MPWYKTGTVSVTQNSNAVIGTGSAFIANSRVGDGFRGPDGLWYEVTNIASNTALSISPNYEGPTVTGGFYSIMPVQGYQKDLSDQVRAILNDYGDKLAALGTTGNYDILPLLKGGTGASNSGDALTGLGFSSFMKTMVDDVNASAARETLVAAKSGQNSDITELTALTTAVPVAMGGTGGKTQAAARSGLGLGSAAVAAIVGAVSQTGGIPTGAIVEFVSNTNGECIRWADGTQICTYRLNTASLTMNSSYAAGLFNSPAFGGGTLPVPFKSGTTPFFPLPGIKCTFGLGWPVLSAKGTSTQWPSYFMISAVAEGGTQFDVPLIAIGRWF